MLARNLAIACFLLLPPALLVWRDAAGHRSAGWLLWPLQLGLGWLFVVLGTQLHFAALTRQAVEATGARQEELWRLATADGGPLTGASLFGGVLAALTFLAWQVVWKLAGLVTHFAPRR